LYKHPLQYRLPGGPEGQNQAKNLKIAGIERHRINIGDKIIEGKITIDNCTYVYGIGNILRMALGGSPSVIFETKDAKDLEDVQKILKKAIIQLQ